MLESILYIVAISGMILLLFFTFSKTSKFLYYLMLIKPFIDLTVNVPIIGSFNALQLSGVIVFIITLVLYIARYSSYKHLNHKVIWMFLGLQLLTFLIAVINETQSVIQGIDFIVRIYEGYFIYFCSRQIMLNEVHRIKFYKMAWITTLSIEVITIIAYWTGNYNIDITRGVIRVGGLFNDPGSPSFIGVISLIFGTLYREISKRQLFKTNILIILNVIIVFYVMAITVTKGAIFMLLVFIILWLGIYKKRLFLVLPIMIISVYVAYIEIDVVQKRMETEVRYLSERTEEAAISMGTGRYGRWKYLMKVYSEEFTFSQKMIGSSKNYAAHNQYIAYLMQAGFLGLLLFIIIVTNFIIKLIKRYRQNFSAEIFAALSLLVCFLSLGISGHPFDYTTIYWYLAIMLGIVNSVGKGHSKKLANIQRLYPFQK